MRFPKKIVSIFFLSILLTFLPVQKSYAANQAGLWVGAGFSSLLYTPIKTAFSLVMGITGSLTMIATVPSGDTHVSAQIIKWGMYGDWIIRPAHLQGHSPVRFVGTTDRMRFAQLETQNNGQMR